MLLPPTSNRIKYYYVEDRKLQCESTFRLFVIGLPFGKKSFIGNSFYTCI